MTDGCCCCWWPGWPGNRVDLDGNEEKEREAFCYLCRFREIGWGIDLNFYITVMLASNWIRLDIHYFVGVFDLLE